MHQRTIRAQGNKTRIKNRQKIKININSPSEKTFKKTFFNTKKKIPSMEKKKIYILFFEK